MDQSPCRRLFAQLHNPFSNLFLTGLGALLIAAIGLWAPPLSAQESDFQTWLQEFRTEAMQRGFKPAIIDAALTDVEPIPRIIELDRKQPEGTLTYAQYLQRVLPESRVQRGRALFRQHRDLLKQVESKYGVPAPVIVALWGVESDFGRRTGGFSIISALATLAYDGRRSAYFRKELLNAIQILDEGHIAPDQMTGSWAGAMGQCQFMPSSFLSRAVDHNGDNRRDIWTTLDDVFASAANYLAKAGWNKGQRWGREVKLPKTFDTSLASLKTEKTLADWQQLGIRRINGRNLPTANFKASVVLPSDSKKPAYLVYNNYRVFLKWNRSTYFALAVGQLANRIGNEN